MGGVGCDTCNSQPLATDDSIMNTAPTDDASIVTAAVTETKVSTTVKLTFVLSNQHAGIQASGGAFTSSTGVVGTVVTEGCTGDNALINWGGKGNWVTGTSEITWTAPSKAGFDVTFWAFTGTGYGSSIKRTSFKISDSDGVATQGPDTGAPTIAPTSATSDTSAPTDDTGAAVRVEIPMALMITLFIGLLKF